MFGMMAPFQPAPPPSNPFDFFESNYRVGTEIAHTRDYLLVLGERR